MHFSTQLLVAVALVSPSLACGGTVTTAGGNTADGGGNQTDGAAGCSGAAPICCPLGCSQPLSRATCSSAMWTCPADTEPTTGVCDADCEADTGPSLEASLPDVGPGPVCPSTYSVYGDTDPADNLGAVDPRLIASGTCGESMEQFSGVDAGSESEAGYGSTDLTITLTQSAPRSGMFVTVIHQTTPFPFDLTTCLESAGHGTGSAPTGSDPGTIALVNDPETPMFPQVQLGTNFTGDNLLFDVAISPKSSFGVGAVDCTFVKN